MAKPKPAVTVLCLHCEKAFSVKPYRRDSVKFCSLSCRDKAKTKRADYVCFECRAQKSVKDFHVDRDKKCGHVARCKACCARYAKTVTNIKPYRRESQYARNAAKRGLQWSLTKAQFMEFWQKPCGYCGGRIETIGIDRINNERGYEIGNIMPCCSTCNAMKSSMSMVQFVAHCRLVAETANRAIVTEGKDVTV